LKHHSLSGIEQPGNKNLFLNKGLHLFIVYCHLWWDEHVLPESNIGPVLNLPETLLETFSLLILAELFLVLFIGEEILALHLGPDVEK